MSAEPTTDDSIEPPPTKPMTPERLDEIQEMVSDWEGVPEEGDATCELLVEVDRQAAEIAAFRQAIKVGDGPSCEDVCQRECIGVCGV